MVLQGVGTDLACRCDEVVTPLWGDSTCRLPDHAQLLAEAVGKPVLIDPASARLTHSQVGSVEAGLFQYRPLYEMTVREQPDLFE